MREVATALIDFGKMLAGISAMKSALNWGRVFLISCE
jgi:hypothetical protein